MSPILPASQLWSNPSFIGTNFVGRLLFAKGPMSDRYLHICRFPGRCLPSSSFSNLCTKSSSSLRSRALYLQPVACLNDNAGGTSRTHPKERKNGPLPFHFAFAVNESRHARKKWKRLRRCPATAPSKNPGARCTS